MTPGPLPRALSGLQEEDLKPSERAVRKAEPPREGRSRGPLVKLKRCR